MDPNAISAQLEAEWTVITQAPFTFAGTVIVIAIAIYLFLRWVSSEQVTTLNSRLSLRDDEIGQLKARATPPTPVLARSASLELHTFGDNRYPTEIATTGVWRWFWLRTIVNGRNNETGEERVLGEIPFLFVTFDPHVMTGTLEVTSPDIQLPHYEVKEFNNRFAVITFDSPPAAGTLHIRVRNRD